MQPVSFSVVFGWARQYEIVLEPGILARCVKGLETHSRAKRLELHYTLAAACDSDTLRPKLIYRVLRAILVRREERASTTNKNHYYSDVPQDSETHCRVHTKPKSHSCTQLLVNDAYSTNAKLLDTL
jgi:hypothetical protein